MNGKHVSNFHSTFGRQKQPKSEILLRRYGRVFEYEYDHQSFFAIYGLCTFSLFAMIGRIAHTCSSRLKIAWNAPTNTFLHTKNAFQVKMKAKYFRWLSPDRWHYFVSFIYMPLSVYIGYRLSVVWFYRTHRCTYFESNRKGLSTILKCFVRHNFVH